MHTATVLVTWQPYWVDWKRWQGVAVWLFVSVSLGSKVWHGSSVGFVRHLGRWLRQSFALNSAHIERAWRSHSKLTEISMARYLVGSVVAIVITQGVEDAASIVKVIVVAVFLEWQLHLSSDDQGVAVLNAHLCQTLGFASDWLLALDVNVHLLPLNQLSQLDVFDGGQDGLMQDFESLVGADFNLELLIEAILKLRGLNLNFEVHAPRLFLAVSAFIVAHWIEEVHVLVHVAHVRLHTAHVVNAHAVLVHMLVGHHISIVHGGLRIVLAHLMVHSGTNGAHIRQTHGLVVEVQALILVVVALTILVHLGLHVHVRVDLRLGLHLVGGEVGVVAQHGLLDAIDSLLVWLHLINMFLILLL